ncbi:Aspartic proteinase nepenthesin-2 [Apostasia shenzhenica]|uniref:Aspartic proteinase nepenthesin-2 n=1 Tax=Apostasia shenzhenica TaxID=1088818 RepID=A0A2I0AS12_9ASPA|nr:Aspartic proteinase nepenthesin-2 [Apostasia shenzhenica]
MRSPQAMSLICSPILFSLILPIYAVAGAPAGAGDTPIVVPLSRFLLPPRRDPLERLAGIASASVLRAQLLKTPTTSLPSARAPLSPHSYGGYSINVSLGTPPQEIPLLVDTGSQLTWIPCTKNYLCRNCSSPANPLAQIPTFLPKSSSTSKLIGCKNPKCGWIHSQEFLSHCRNCPSNSSDCPKICPPYLIIYGSGSTAGLLLSETLHFSSRTIADFVVGCSVFSQRQPAGGIAGFGRGTSSLPSQLGLKRFSYCLISRRFDDDPGESGSLVLNGLPDSSDGSIRFTPLVRNPISPPASADAADGPSAFSVYYYIGLRKITVGGKKVQIPYKALAPGADGNGGTIVDSGTTFTFMEPPVFEPVAAAFVAQVAGRLNRSGEVEGLTGLKLCFELPEKAVEVSLPALVFHFKGGAEMQLPVENYFVLVGSSRPSICLTVVSGGRAAGTVSRGPAIILGSFQQQDFYMLYDLERERLGFRQQSCIAK